MLSYLYEKNTQRRSGMTEYLSEEVVYGGLVVTRAAMIADLQHMASAMTKDPVRQQALVSRYLQGFESR
jgi:phosphoribosylcarboxyaminoimidazole (NCAIR) mutase